MHHLRKQFLAVVVVSLLSLWWGSVAVYACTPSPETSELTLADRVNNAPIILVGTVVEGYLADYDRGRGVLQAVDVEVERYLKGEGPAIVHIVGFGDGADCRSVVAVGDRGIFFAEGNPDEDLSAVYLGVHDAVWSASEETITTVRSMTGTDNEPYPLPLTAQLQRFISSNPVAVAGLLFAGAALLMIVLIWQQGRRRKPKSKRI